MSDQTIGYYDALREDVEAAITALLAEREAA